MVEPKPESFRVIEGDGLSTTHDEPPDSHVGAFLREARENTGRTVDDVAANLRIGAKFLKSIEDGRYEDLPGPTYAIGFIRSYAEYLGLDAEALVVQFKSQSSGAEGQPELEFPVPTTVGWFPTGKVVAICALLAVVVFTGWFFAQTEDSIDVTAIPLPPGFKSAVAAGAAESQADQTAAAAPAQPESAAAADRSAGEQVTMATAPPAAAEAAAAPADTEEDISEDEEKPYVLPVPIESLVLPDPIAMPSDLIQTEPAPEVTALAPVDSAVEVPAAAEPAAATAEPSPVVTVPAAADEQPAPAENDSPSVVSPPPPQVAALPSIPGDSSEVNATGGGRTYGVINQEARVVIGAQADSWVQVTDDNQNVVLTRLLRAGDRYLVPNRRDLVMSTGNAGGLIISVDGAPVPELGIDGAVLHNVRLDIELLKAGRAVVQ